jgi:uncharacterized membrane protein
MGNSKLNSWLVEIVAAVFILLFVYTALSKLHDQDTFQTVLTKSPLIGQNANYVSWLLPMTELIVAALLLIPKTKIIGLQVSFLLMCVFTAYIIYMLHFTPKLPCSCGGVLKNLSWREHLALNAFLTILALLGIFLSTKNKFFIAINRKSRIPV